IRRRQLPAIGSVQIDKQTIDLVPQFLVLCHASYLPPSRYHAARYLILKRRAVAGFWALRRVSMVISFGLLNITCCQGRQQRARRRQTIEFSVESGQSRAV